MDSLKTTEIDSFVRIPFTIIKANTFRKRLLGLMFRKKPLEKEGLWIYPCNSIHMCFMQFPIDVVFLDRNNQIVKTIQNLKPWRFVAPIKNAYSVIELPIGTIEKFNLKNGQPLEL